MKRWLRWPALFLAASLLAVLFSLLSPALSASAEGKREALARAAREAPDDLSVQIAHIEALTRAAEYGEAQAIVNRIRRRSPRSLELHLAEARIIFARGDLKNARRACAKLQRIDARAIETRLCVAEGFLALQRSARAFEELDALIREAPDRFEIRFARAEAMRQRMQLEEAEAEYQEAARISPKDPRPSIGLGLLYEAAGKRGEARRALSSVSGEGELYPELLLALGRLSSGLAARDALERANKARADWPEALIALAQLDLEERRHGDALRRFDAAIKHDPHAALAHLGRGLSLSELSRDAEARVSLDKALELVPTLSRAHLERARIEARHSEVEEALESYRKAADLDRASIVPLLEAAALCIESRRPTFALAYLDRAMEQEPESARLLMLYGDALALRGKKDEARGFYERARRGKGAVDRAALERAIRAVE